jgi:outer membrane protein assembly factor BamB
MKKTIWNYVTSINAAVLAALGLLLLISSCDSETNPTVKALEGGLPSENASYAVASPFPIAAPSVVYSASARTKAASSLLSRLGSEIEADYCQRVTLAEPQANYSPAWNNGNSSFSTVAYAIYRFDLTARVGRIKVNTQWSHAPADYTRLWIGISNWELDRWDWYSGAPSGAVQSKPVSMDWYKRADTGTTLVTVVLLGQSSASLSSIWLSGFSMRGDWWMDDRNAQRDSCSVAVGPAYPDISWTLPMGCTSTPIYDANGMIYIFARGSSELWLTTVNPAGQLLLNKPVAAAPEGTNCAAALGDDGTVYCAFPDKLYACTPDGALLWDYPLDGVYTLGLAVASDGTLHADVLAADSAGQHYAVYPDGTLRWEYAQQGASPSSAAAIAQDGAVYCPTNQGLISFSREGSVNWTYGFDTPYCSTPCVTSSGTVYVNDFSNNELCAIQSDGTLAWSTAISGGPAGAPALGPSGEIQVWDQSGGLNSFSPAGVVLWRHQLNTGWDNLYHPLAIDRAGTTIFLGGDALLTAVNSQGATNWWHETYAFHTSKLCIGEDGTIYFHDYNNLYAIGPGGSVETHQASGYVKDVVGKGIAGVCVAITGRECVITDETGYWSRDGLADGAYAVAPILSGFSFTPELATVEIAGQDESVADFISGPAAAIWPMSGNNGQHTRRSSAVGPSMPTLDWSASLNGSIYSEPMIAHDGSVVVCGSPNLRCYSAAGNELWTKSNAEFSSSQAPAIGHDQKVYARGSALYAYTSSGSLVWSQLPAGNAPAIAADGGILQVSEGIRKLAPDGNLVWLASPADWRSSTTTPAIAPDGTIYAGNGKDALYAFSDTGEEQWRADAVPDSGSPYWQSTPAIGADGTIYLGSGMNVYAFNPDGSEQWGYPNTAKINMSPGIGPDGTIYYTTKDTSATENNLLVALHSDGTLKWEYSADGYYFTAPPSIDGSGTVYIGIYGALHAVNPDGTRKWTFDDPAGEVAGVAIGADGTLYFGDSAGYLYALGPGAG